MTQPIQSTNTVASIFSRLDNNSDQLIDSSEVRQFVEQAGHNHPLRVELVDSFEERFMSNFDNNFDGKVTLEEFRSNAGKLLPGTISFGRLAETINDSGASLQQRQLAADSSFDRVDRNKDGLLSRRELNEMARIDSETYCSPRWECTGPARSDGFVAENVDVELLDSDGSEIISREEYQELVADIIGQIEEGYDYETRPTIMADHPNPRWE